MGEAMIKRGVWLWLLALLTGCAGLGTPPDDPAARATLVHTPAPASNLTRTAAAQPTRNDYFRVHLLLPEGGRLALGDNPVQIRVLNRRGDSVDGASVRLQLWLPSLAREGPACLVRETEAGLYQVSGLNLSQPGDWMLTVTINRSGREDWAVYELPVEAPPPTPAQTSALSPAAPVGKGPTVNSATRSAPPPAAPAPAKAQAAAVAPTPAKLSLARSRASDRRLYKVSYHSQPAQARPRKPVAWRVTLLTKAGRPVEGAKLSLRLSRPSEASEKGLLQLTAKGQGKGRYLVEGLRFPDKGWWRVSLEISSQRGRDRVDFHLVVK